MLGYPFIEDLNRSVLLQSAAIQGRFFLCPLGGQELNQPSLEEVVKATFDGKGLQKKEYPLVIMMPPYSSGDYGKKQYWKNYSISMYFLQQHGADLPGGAGPMAMNPSNGMSNHTVIQDWHDMERVALDYFFVMRQLVTGKNLSTYYRVSDKEEVSCSPVSMIGNDRTNGVLLQYGASVFMDHCAGPVDYPANFSQIINISTTDSHPNHYTQTPPID